METFDFKIGQPAHGWCCITLRSHDKKLEIDASDVPGDSLEMLARAVCLLNEGRNAEAVFFLEPVEYSMNFSNSKGNTLLEVIDKGPNGFNKNGQVLFQAKVPTKKVSHRIWKAFKDAQSKFSENNWSNPFPSSLVERAGQLIKSDQ